MTDCIYEHIVLKFADIPGCITVLRCLRKLKQIDVSYCTYPLYCNMFGTHYNTHPKTVPITKLTYNTYTEVKI